MKVKPKTGRAYTHGIPITCGVDVKLTPGDEIYLPWMNGTTTRARVLKRVTRAQHVNWTEEVNRRNKNLGRSPGHTGAYDPFTREYIPGLKPPPRVKYFYWLELIDP
jgi:hypothetical protein